MLIIISMQCSHGLLGGDNAKDVDLNELDRGKQIVWDILGYVDLS